MNENLIIIGNGFDLRCGLKSKYLDFYNYQIKSNKWLQSSITILETIKDQINHKNIFEPKLLKDSFVIDSNFSYWDLVFILMDWSKNKLGTNQTWTDIESMMRIALYEILYKVNYDNYPVNDNEIYAESAYKSIPIILQICLRNNDLFYTYKKGWIKFLLDQLNNFKKRFSNYIEAESTSNELYSLKAQTLARSIALGEHFDIVSFNYTSPFIKTSYDVVNIHGLSSKEDIVFGICLDSEKEKIIAHQDEKRVFTKEFQELGLMINGISVSTPTPLYKTISIYGLSLNGQDFDFFENLFDRHDLLGKCQTKFAFCYSVYDEEKEKEIKEAFEHDIYSLITRYGDERNKANLLTSLLYDGTITIRKI